jgi:hypothetical protein
MCRASHRQGVISDVWKSQTGWFEGLVPSRSSGVFVSSFKCIKRDFGSDSRMEECEVRVE